jgi:hypothetical protein
MTQSGIDPATFRFVPQCLNHCATACPQSKYVEVIYRSKTESKQCILLVLTIHVHNHVSSAEWNLGGHRFKDYFEVETVVTRWLINTGQGLVSTGSLSQDATNASVGGSGDVTKSWSNDTVTSEPFMLQFYKTGIVSIRQNRRSHNRYYRGKKLVLYIMNVFLYTCIFSAPYCHLACLAVPYSSTLSHKQLAFRMLHWTLNVCSDFLYKFCPKHFSF